MNRGVGYAKNAAIQQCTSDCLCFLDADDVMDARRIELQIKMAVRILNVPFKLRISIGFAVADWSKIVFNKLRSFGDCVVHLSL